MQTKSLFPDMPKPKRVMPKVPKNTKPYRPSSNWEADSFFDQCHTCINFISHKCKTCPCADCKYDLRGRSEAFEITSKNYPKWLVSDLDGSNERCLLFKKR